MVLYNLCSYLRWYLRTNTGEHWTFIRPNPRVWTQSPQGPEPPFSQKKSKFPAPKARQNRTSPSLRESGHHCSTHRRVCFCASLLHFATAATAGRSWANPTKESVCSHVVGSNSAWHFGLAKSAQVRGSLRAARRSLWPLSEMYSSLQKKFNTRQRDENSEILCVF